MPSCRFFLIAFVPVLFIYFIVPPPRPKRPLCPQRKPTYVPGESLILGISLSASYGTISMRNANGFFTDIGRIDGDGDYVAMMRRFSSISSSHPAPPYDGMEEQWDDQPRQWLRDARKMLFLPASSDVRRLSGLARSLVHLARSQAAPHASIASVVISYPALPGVFAEDIIDTARYLSLPQLSGGHGYPPRTLISSYAGHGMGLCASYYNASRCREEGLDHPVRSTLLVDYTSSTILMHAESMREAYGTANSDIDVSTWFLSPTSERINSDADELVRRKLLSEMVVELLNRKWERFRGPPEPLEDITVLLTGNPDDIDVDQARKRMEEAVDKAGFKAQMYHSNPEFIASQGAAEMAWRALTLHI
ncbi:hypothetical protein K458DRAFT_352532 [Lentithecium fluviatile CBS 122367]|uniref:Uncharacterized protein n=1 Tax=Lentithecium fluviatile CBS 122367 TaxID=1168545 RepID=A0A6G1IDF4_9PLEO|nr:hypothetical protein K458DRAFT_352532 [Lentithecium fluviatile CBS 122367]